MRRKIIKRSKAVCHKPKKKEAVIFVCKVEDKCQNYANKSNINTTLEQIKSQKLEFYVKTCHVANHVNFLL